MSRIDIDLVLKKMELLRKDLHNLEKFQSLTFSEFIEDDIKRASIERFLERITGRLIDINYHILREEYEILPEDYYSSFIYMGKQKIIPESLALEISKSAGLRNALAHEYDKVDDQKIYNSINMALTEVPKYLQKILNFIS